MGLSTVQYKNSTFFTHQQAGKVGILVTNLGTPDAPDSPSLRRYLKQFLSDPRVVEFPRLLWWLILNGIILRIRPGRSAKAYKKVWTDQGSPLAIHTKNQAQALQEKLSASIGNDVVVSWAMRYGNPSMDSAIQQMMEQGVRKLLVLPLYPQYSASTTASTFDALAEDFRQRRWIPELRFVTCYHDYPPYIAAVGDKIKRHWDTHGKAQKLIFSFHGVPLRYLHNGDPYHCQCHATSRLLAAYLGLGEDDYLTTFQSRFGREPWLKPYTDHTLEALPEQGVKSIQVVCPGFSSDCLETIEEINMENRELFLEAGGESFDYITALNDEPDHIQALAQLVEQHLQGWLNQQPEDTSARCARYEAHQHNLTK